MRGVALLALAALFSLSGAAADPPSTVSPLSIDLLEQYDFSFIGGDAEDQMGVQARFGDLDGDGYDDIILGAWLADGAWNNRMNAGEVYIFFGRPLDIVPAEPLSATLIYGADPGDRIGSCVDIGDFNGDGVQDLLIGARYADGNPDSLRPHAGEAFLLIGNSDWTRRDVVDVRTAPDMILVGREPGDHFGRRILIADLDEDGKEDMLIAALGESGREGETPGAGAIYLIYGDDRKEMGGIFDLSLQDVPVLHGSDESDGLGGAMAVADWNGDTVPDLVLGCGFADGPANSRTNAGETYVLFGEPGRRLSGEREIVEGNEFTIYGAESYDAAGIAVDAGDFDGDGIDDLAIGANLADGPENGRDNCGEVYILFGRRSWGEGTTVDLAHEADIVVYGSERGDQAGAIVSLFDWSGDGYADLVTSSLLHDGPEGIRQDAGMLFVVRGGRQGDLRPEVDLAGDRVDLRMLGPSAHDKIATSLTAVITGGRPALMAATMLGDGPRDERRDAGEIYILRWKPDGAE